MTGIATGGPLVVAVAVAALAGLVSFLSPCVLPLVPGYLSYVTGLAGADLDDALQRPSAAARGRILVGTGGFVVGYTIVFLLTTVLVSSLGHTLLSNMRALQVVVGLLVIALGLGFLGLIPGLQREFRIHSLPRAGLLGAPVLGAVFALGWSPCIGPTFAVVLGMATASGTATRGVTLTIAYCLGLGLPFLAFGLGFRKLLGVFRAIRRNSVWVTRLGGALMILVGLALATGVWDSFTVWLRSTAGVGGVQI
jgi:cytochrome c-type biogenesis protein